MDSMTSRSEDWLLDTLNTELARLNDRLAEMTPLVQRRDAVQTAIDALNGRLTTEPTVAKGRPLGWGKRRAQVVDILRQARHAGITVSDLDRSIAFYRDVLGCELVVRQEKQGGYLAAIVGHPDAHLRMARLRLPGSEHLIELFQYLAPTGQPVEIRPWNVGTSHLCFRVDDLRSLHARLVARGVDGFVGEPVEIDTGANAGGRSVYLRDPDGLIVELFEAP